MDHINMQVLVPPPLTKERLAQVRAHLKEIYDDLIRQGIDPNRLADPVEMLRQMRDASSTE